MTYKKDDLMIKTTMNLVISLNFAIQAPALNPHPVREEKKNAQSLIEVTIDYFNVGNV